MSTLEDYFEVYLKNYTRVLSFVMFFFGIYYYITIEHIVLALSGVIFGPLTFMIPYIYKKSALRLFCANLTLVYSFAFVTTIILCTGGINSWVLTWYIVGPFFSGLLGGTRPLYFWGALVIISTLLLDYFDLTIQKLSYQITEPEILNQFKIRSLIIPILLSVFLTSLYMKLMKG